MLTKRNRIANQRLIAKITKVGRVYKTAHFVFKFLPSALPDSKFAISVSKKIAVKAVDRNKVRRQIGECLRHNLLSIKKPIVTVIIMKRGSPEKMQYTDIETEMTEFINYLNEDA